MNICHGSGSTQAEHRRQLRPQQVREAQGSQPTEDRPTVTRCKGRDGLWIVEERAGLATFGLPENRGRSFLSQWCCLRPKLGTLYEAELLRKRQFPAGAAKDEAEVFIRPCFSPDPKGTGQKQAAPWSPHTTSHTHTLACPHTLACAVSFGSLSLWGVARGFIHVRSLSGSDYPTEVL